MRASHRPCVVARALHGWKEGPVGRPFWGCGQVLPSRVARTSGGNARAFTRRAPFPFHSHTLLLFSREPKHHKNRLLVRTSPVGTTAEIRSGYGGSAGDDADSGGGGFAVMARGRHRFRLVEDLGWRCAAQNSPVLSSFYQCKASSPGVRMWPGGWPAKCALCDKYRDYG